VIIAANGGGVKRQVLPAVSRAGRSALRNCAPKQPGGQGGVSPLQAGCLLYGGEAVVYTNTLLAYLCEPERNRATRIENADGSTAFSASVLP